METNTKQLSHDVQMLFNSFAPIRHLLDDRLVQEVMVNGPNNVWVERAGEGITKTEIQITETNIASMIVNLGGIEKKHVKESGLNSIVDARIDGFRFAAAMKGTSLWGPTVTIRKHNPVHLSLADYVANGAVPEEMAKVLSSMVKEHKNVIIAGGTSSGKTTFANALIGEIDMNERVITIEDTQELKVLVPHWVAYISNEQQGVTTRDLVKLSLRSRPDRIIVGEVRGGEAFDLLDAANTGHDGCLATMHANSALAALRRFETLILRSNLGWPHEAIQTQIGDTFDYVVFMARTQAGRRLAEIIRVNGFDRVSAKYITETIYRNS